MDTDVAVVEDELPCAGCEYDLRNLPIGGNCPECGTPIARSLERGTLHHADPRWLRRLAVAGWLVPASLAFGVAVQLALQAAKARLGLALPAYDGWIALNAVGQAAVGAAALAGPAVSCLRPAPARFDLAPRRRRAVLLLAGVAVLADVGGNAVSVVGSRVAPASPSPAWVLSSMQLFGVMFLASTAVAFGLALSHAAALLDRVPRSLLPRAMRGVLWGFLACAAITAALPVVDATGVWRLLPRGWRWYVVAPLNGVAIVLFFAGLLASAVLAPLGAMRVAATRRVALRLASLHPASGPPHAA